MRDDPPGGADSDTDRGRSADGKPRRGCTRAGEARRVSHRQLVSGLLRRRHRNAATRRVPHGQSDVRIAVAVASIHEIAPRPNSLAREVASRHSIRLTASVDEALLDDPRAAQPKLAEESQTIIAETARRGVPMMAGSVVPWVPLEPPPPGGGRPQVAMAVAAAPYHLYAIRVAELLERFSGDAHDPGDGRSIGAGGQAGLLGATRP